MLRSTALALALFASAGFAQAATISVTFSEDFAEKLADDYGDREGPVLTREVIDDLERALARENVDIDRIDVVINDAKPNRPTFTQLGDRPGLDMTRSISLGGMDLSGAAYDADGNMVAEVDYDWYEFDIRNVVGSGTWTDARRASSRFANRVADALVEN